MPVVSKAVNRITWNHFFFERHHPRSICGKIGPAQDPKHPISFNTGSLDRQGTGQFSGSRRADRLKNKHSLTSTIFSGPTALLDGDRLVASVW